MTGGRRECRLLRRLSELLAHREHFLLHDSYLLDHHRGIARGGGDLLRVTLDLCTQVFTGARRQLLCLF